MSEQPVTPAQPVNPDATKPVAQNEVAGKAAPAADKQPPWGKPENFDAEKAWDAIQNLRNENRGIGEMKAELEKYRQDQVAQEAQKKALAEVLGFAETPKSEDALAETVKTLQAQFAATQREANLLRVAAEKNIPAEYHDLLTETDPEKLAAQAEKVSALVVAKSAAEGTPAFQANPGQGKGTGAPVQDDSYPAHWLPQRQQ